MVAHSGLHRFTNLVEWTISAGPTVAPSRAEATVLRLRKADEWALGQLERFIPDASTVKAVRATPVEYLNRRSLFRVGVYAIRMLMDRRGLFVRTVSAVLMGTLGRRVAYDLKGMFDFARGVRIIVAPNVLTEAQRFDLDQSDWCRWVSLRTALNTAHHLHAPFLSEHLIDLMENLSESGEEFARFTVLADSLTRALMDSMTTADLASIGWIRSHDVDVMASAHSDLIHHLVGKVCDIPVAVAQCRNFASEVVSNGLLLTLLERKENLPTLTEFAQPAAWIERVGNR